MKLFLSPLRVFWGIFALIPLHCNSFLDKFSEPFYVHEYHLENGLSVYLSVNHKEPVIKTSILVSVGSADDPEDATGLAHYLEHMMFKGTSKIGTTNYALEKPFLEEIENLYEDYRSTSNDNKRKQIYAKIDKASLDAAKFVIPNEFSRIQSLMGIYHSNAFTSHDRTLYVATVPSNQIGNYLQLEWERFRDPIFRTFHTELETVFEERNLRVTDNQSNLFKQYHGLLFQNHPYGEKSPIGTDKDLKNPSLRKIKSFFNEHYIPSKMAICMSGDLNPDEVIAQIKKTFGKAPNTLPIQKPSIPEHKPQEADRQIVVNSNKKIFLFGVKIPKQSPKLSAEANTVALLLSNRYNGLLEESLFYSQKANSVSVSITEWKEYILLNILVEPSRTLSLTETKTAIISAFQKIEKMEVSEEIFQSIKTNQRLDLIKKKDDNEFRLNEISEAYLSHWSYGDLQKKYQTLKQTNLEDLSKFVNEFVNGNIISVETVKGKIDFTYITKPPISKLEFSEKEESDFKKSFSTEPSDSLTPEFADLEKIQSKTYPNGNQIIFQKNKENSLFHFKIIIEGGAWISPYLSAAIDYWKHLGTDLYTASALSTKFYLLGSSVNIDTVGESLEITMEGEDEQFIVSFRLLEHSIKSVASSKEIWKTLVKDRIEIQEDNKENETEIDYALREFALFGKNSLRLFQATPEELKKIKSSDAINLLGDLLKFKSKLIYYGNLDFDTLENTVFQEYISLPKAHDTSSLTKKSYRDRKVNTFYIIKRNRPHVELNYFSNFYLDPTTIVGSVSIYNAIYSGLASPFFMTLREQTGNAYSANVVIIHPEFSNDPYIWYINLSCQADKIKSCLSDAKKSLEAPQLSKYRFEEAKISVLKSLSTIRKSNSNLIDEYIRSLRLGLSEDPDKYIYESIQNVEWNDFLEFTKNMKASSSFQIALIGDPQRFDLQSIRNFGEVRELKESNILGR